MSQKLSPIWLKRWQALEKTINNTNIQDTTLSSMLTCLKAFGEDQFRFFYDGFNDGRLLPSVYHPAEYVLSAILAQVSYDLSAIRQAADQRRTPELKAILDKADQLAQSALNLAIEKGLLKTGGVVTYFDKSPYIRVIPYAPVALIGIPYTSIESPRDLLAIPHEVGHYVYHHTTGLAAKLHTQIPFDPPWFNQWLEEIFADIYGCLIAGPVIGLDFQDLLLDNPTEHFTEDDGYHPIDAIRPFIYIQILETLGFKNATEALETRWDGYRMQRNYPETFVPHGTDDEIDLDYAREKTEDVVSYLSNYLLTEFNLTPTTCWSDDLAAGTGNIDSLYTTFEQWIQQPLAIPVHKLQIKNDKVGIESDNGKLQNSRHIGDTNTWRDGLKQLAKKGKVLPWPAWLHLFIAGFWPVKGPEGNGNTGL